MCRAPYLSLSEERLSTGLWVAWREWLGSGVEWAATGPPLWMGLLLPQLRVVFLAGEGGLALWGHTCERGYTQDS